MELKHESPFFPQLQAQRFWRGFEQPVFSNTLQTVEYIVKQEGLGRQPPDIKPEFLEDVGSSLPNFTLFASQ
ncbi:Hypothetical protein FKW44_007123 [Caligus rogercresseyi]|uniref:Uncharacterized protein n=1 Tax=Caligus rogercresseyi TaxID=217165 RepID=A0A7T8KEK1_CALRO|nr:Hypothetical protein FKW44_007123 [Caligus rogercresseyi]